MAKWNGAPLPTVSNIKIPDTIPKNFNWSSYVADPSGTFNKFKGAREVQRLNWKGYATTSKKIKNIVGSSPSRRVISEAGKRIRTLKGLPKTVKKAQEELNNAQKIVKTLNTDVKKMGTLWDRLLSKVRGKTQAAKASKASGSLATVALLAGLVAVLAAKIVTDIQIQNIGFDDDVRNESEFQKAFDRYQKTAIDVRATNRKVDELNKKIQINNKDIDSMSKSFFEFKTLAREAKTIGNNALYEVRQGRKILEERINKQTTTFNNLKTQLQGEVNQVVTNIKTQQQQQQQQFNQRIAEVLKAIPGVSTGVSNTVQAAINSTVNTAISKVQSDINSVKAQVNSIKPQTPIDVNAIINNAVTNTKNIAQQEINNLRNQVSGLNNLISGLQIATSTALSIGSANTKDISQIDKKADAAFKEAKNKGFVDFSPVRKELDDKFNAFVEQNKKDLGIRDLKQSELSKQFDNKLAEFEKLSSLDSNQRFNEFVKSNNEALKIRDLKQSELSKEFDRKIADFERLSKADANQRFDEFTKQNKADLNTIKNDLTKIDTKIKERERVDKEVERKIDSLIPKIDSMLPNIAGIPLIAGNAANLIRPSIPTIPQIEAASAAGTCRTTQPGGCSRKMIDDAIGDIKNNNNQNTRSLLDNLGSAADLANLALLPTINNKLGDQVDGGLSGFLKKNFKWLQLDRITNMITLWVTIHNARMLSANLFETLLNVIENGLTIVGIKDADGSPIDLGEMLGKQVQEIIKGAIGADNYNELSAQWKRASTIYRSTANVLDRVTGLTNSVINGLEVVGSQVAKIGNALRWYGKVREKAYETFNPNPNFKAGGVIDKINNLDDAANFVLQVSQVPIDVMQAQKDLVEANTEFAKVIKEETKKGIIIEEATKTKQANDASKAVSSGVDWSKSDVFSAND